MSRKESSTRSQAELAIWLGFAGRQTTSTTDGFFLPIHPRADGEMVAAAFKKQLFQF